MKHMGMDFWRRMIDMEKSEIRDYIIWYLTENNDKKTLKDYRKYEAFIKEEFEVTEALLRENAIPEWDNRPEENRIEIMTELFKSGRCPDLALLEVKRLTDQLKFVRKEYQMKYHGYEWKKDHEEQLKKWLLCQTDEFPAVIPLTDSPQLFVTHDHHEMLFAATSKVCDFPVRYCAYTMFRGYVWEYKFPFRALIAYREEGYADSVIERIKEIYARDFRLNSEEIDTEIKRAFAAVYCSRDKKKIENAFYQRYIDKWMTEDKDGFINMLRSTMTGDLRSKVLKKLTGSAK